jgi:hypothetical protein
VYPFEIQKGNPLDFSLSVEEYAVKSGMMVNQTWGRSAHEWDKLKAGNIEKYGLAGKTLPLST